MPTKFFVAECYRYSESKNWEWSVKGMYDTLEAAKQVYHARLGALIKDTNDHVMVILYDSWGTRIDADYVNTYVEPEPELEPEVEGE